MPANEPSSTALPSQPRLRRVESFPVSQPGGKVVFALRDPEGFAGSVVLPYHAAVLASLMDGRRTLSDMREDFQRQFGQSVSLADVEKLVRDLDDRYFLDTERFRVRWKAEIEAYLNRAVRPAAHAGSAYPAEPETLRRQIAAIFAGEKGPGLPRDAAKAGDQTTTGPPPTCRLCGVLSPHVDLVRAGPALAQAYKTIADRTDADLFVILGTAHNPMRNLYALTRKDFETPLGVVETDRKFVSRLNAKMARTPAGQDLNLLADELAHRQEHSIEFQLLFLQFLLDGRRPFTIVPILVGSFHEFVAQRVSPRTSPQVSSFAAALRETEAEHPGRVCYISSGDLAHIGQRYGDRAFLDPARLKAQAESDRELLAAACKPDADGFFGLIARDQDRHRVCGLSPTYTMLAAVRPTSGELLRYDQAVELDGTSCVSFASAAFSRE
jgi:AmmeMemoRadiSam system protein B